MTRSPPAPNVSCSYLRATVRRWHGTSSAVAEVFMGADSIRRPQTPARPISDKLMSDRPYQSGHVGPALSAHARSAYFRSAYFRSAMSRLAARAIQKPPRHPIAQQGRPSAKGRKRRRPAEFEPERQHRFGGVKRPPHLHECGQQAEACAPERRALQGRSSSVDLKSDRSMHSSAGRVAHIGNESHVAGETTRPKRKSSTPRVTNCRDDHPVAAEGHKRKLSASR
jgi:hypothetical protein